MEAFVFEGHFPFPGKCAMCGTTKGRGIDIGVDYPEVMFSDEARRGAVLICENCVKLIGSKFDLVEKAQFENDVSEHLRQVETLASLTERVKDDLNSIANGVVALGIDLNPPTPVENDKIAEVDAEDGFDSLIGQGNGTSVEQDSDGISSDSSSLFGELLSDKPKSGKSTK